MSSSRRTRTGRVITALPVLFLLFDTFIKFAEIDAVADSFVRLGYSTASAPAIGVVELLCLAAYLVPRTSVAGAVILTGFLGGAVATHVRVGDPLFSHILFPVYVATLLWLGLGLRDARVVMLLRPAFSTN